MLFLLDTSPSLSSLLYAHASYATLGGRRRAAGIGCIGWPQAQHDAIGGAPAERGIPGTSLPLPLPEDGPDADCRLLSRRLLTAQSLELSSVRPVVISTSLLRIVNSIFSFAL